MIMEREIHKVKYKIDFINYLVENDHFYGLSAGRSGPRSVYRFEAQWKENLAM
jgi:hypothetical protein